MSDHKVLGLDLSLRSTGICSTSGEPRAIVTHKDLRGMPRLAYLVGVIEHELASWPPDLVVIEGYSFGSKSDTLTQLAELGGIVRWEVLRRRGLPALIVPPQTLKLYATGKGSGTKTPVVVAARDRLGYGGVNDDEADALWLRALGLDWLGAPLVKLPKTQREALSKVEYLKPGDLS